MMLVIEMMTWVLGMKLSKRVKGMSANGAMVIHPTNIIPTAASANRRSCNVGRAVTTENSKSLDRSIWDILNS